MKVVIDISEEDYAETMYKKQYSPREMDWIDRVIAKGTPLPKGHGRLIDADELKKHKYHDSNRYENAVAVAQIDWAETVIGADKGEQESEVQQ